MPKHAKAVPKMYVNVTTHPHWISNLSRFHRSNTIWRETGSTLDHFTPPFHFQPNGSSGLRLEPWSCHHRDPRSTCCYMILYVAMWCYMYKFSALLSISNASRVIVNRSQSVGHWLVAKGKCFLDIDYHWHGTSPASWRGSSPEVEHICIGLGWKLFSWVSFAYTHHRLQKGTLGSCKSGRQREAQRDAEAGGRARQGSGGEQQGIGLQNIIFLMFTCYIDLYCLF